MNASLIITVIFLIVVCLSIFGVIALPWTSVCIAYLATLAVFSSIPIRAG